MKLTAANVGSVFSDCYCDTNNVDDPNYRGKEFCIEVEGIMCNVWFDKETLERWRVDIISMLQELPDPFFMSKGGGWSF